MPIGKLRGPAKSIVWQVVLPAPVALLVLLGAVAYVVPHMVAGNVKRTAVLSAIQTVTYLKELRAYYTEAVVNKAISSGRLVPSRNHEGNAYRIPVPATMIHDLSQRLEAEDTTVRLYSMHPFPGRENRILDDFQQQAWAYLIKNPDQVFERQETRGGREVVRVAVADRMVAEACVDCHNGHPETPRDGWELGDVRGVLQVDTAITEPLAFGSKLSVVINSTILLAATCVIIIVFLAARRIAKPLGSVTRAMELVSMGEDSIEVPELERPDEVGKMARAVEVFRNNLVTLAQLMKGQREQSEQLSSALKKEKEYSALHREFVTMASHEFRTPLTIIDAAAQKIIRRKDRLTPEDLGSRGQAIRSAVKRMIDLIESTLTTASLDSGKMEMKAQAHDLRGLIVEACERQQGISETHRISVDVAGLPEQFSGDPGMLGQVFTNLLSNAVKYSPGHPDIDVRGRVEGCYAVVSVADHGLGIAPDEVARLFQRFFRASTSKGIPGTGMGLHLVKHLVAMHGGHLEVESEIGKGTTFKVYLPLDDSEVDARATSQAAAE